MMVEDMNRTQLEAAVIENDIVDMDNEAEIDRVLEMDTEELRGLVIDWIEAGDEAMTIIEM